MGQGLGYPFLLRRPGRCDNRFSPRKQSLTIYVMAGFDRYDELAARLGKHTTGRACLYVKKLEDVDMKTTRELIERSVAHVAAPDP